MVATLEHGYLRSASSGNVRKLGGDVTAANQHDPPRQALEVQKALTRDHMFRAGNLERHRTCAGSKNDVTAVELLSCYSHRVGAGEPCKAVKSINALCGIMGLLFLRYRISKGPFEGDEFGPTDPEFAGNPVTPHAVCGIDGLGPTDEHLLGVASA